MYTKAGNVEGSSRPIGHVSKHKSGSPAGTTENQSKMEYAGFWIRLAAWLIDVILLCIISWGIVNIAYFIGLWV